MRKYLHQYFFIKNKIFLLKIFVILIVIGIWIKQTYTPLTMPMLVNEADAYSRLWHITNLPISDIWLPGFQYIMRIFSIIPDNGFFLNYRIGIYFFTILLSIVLLLIIQKTTNNFLLSLLGLSLFLFHPLTKQLSVTTLTEIPWLFFLFLSLYFLFFTRHKNKIIFGLLAFTISETFRYESWFLLVILIPYLIYLPKVNKLIKIKSVLLIIIFPIFWMLVLNKFYDSPISFIFGVIKCSRGGKPLIFLDFKDLLDIFWLQINTYIFPTIFVFFLLLSGLFIKKTKIISISIVSIYLFLCFFLVNLTSINDNITPRYFYFLVPTLAVIIPFCFYSIYKNYKKNLFKFIIIILYVVISTQDPGFKLNDDYYTNMNNLEMDDIEEISLILKNSNYEKIYMCTQADDYIFSTFIAYRLKYKNIYSNCIDDSPKVGKSSVVIISSQDENIYDLKIKYSNKIKFLNHIVYENIEFIENN